MFPAAAAVTTQFPAALNVTTPVETVHVPLTLKVGLTPVAVPVTVEVTLAAGEYVPPETGEPGTFEVKAITCPA